SEDKCLKILTQLRDYYGKEYKLENSSYIESSVIEVN
ncbi:hypothetical protein LCGC14_2373850, partial [marine sediment metagenome]